MKRIILFAICTAAVLTAACNKDYQVTDPVVDVSGAFTAKAGQPVVFDLNTKADMVTFYSGEIGSSYEYKDHPRFGAGHMELSFLTTTTDAGTKGHPNPAVLPLTYSTDFNGIYTREAMEAAHWTDISHLFAFPTDINQASVGSGIADISSFFPENDSPIYFRFHFRVAPYDKTLYDGQGNTRTQWQVTNFNINTNIGSSNVLTYDMMSQKWQFIGGDGFDTIPEDKGPSLPTASKTRILFRTDATPTVVREMWAVSGPIHRQQDVNLGMDRGTGIKSLADNQMSSYSYIYTKPGEYKATFVGINANMNGHKEVVRNVKVTIVQDSGTISGPEHQDWK